jgi:uncharacterized protein YodC (DUF2158 family)
MENTKPMPGDLVRLRSGGPVMTTERTWYDQPLPHVSCVWFDVRQLPQRSNFKIEALRPFDFGETTPG